MLCGLLASGLEEMPGIRVFTGSPQAGVLSGALDNLAAAVFGAAFLVYPALLGVREMARIVREEREGRGEESVL